MDSRINAFVSHVSIDLMRLKEIHDGISDAAQRGDMEKAKKWAEEYLRLSKRNVANAERFLNLDE